MANRKNHRRFGNIRKRASGRYQARYIGPDGIERTAPNTFATEKQAEKWLTLVEADIIKGDWEPPEVSEIKVSDYGEKWIKERKIQPRTREGYEDLFRLYIKPHLGKLSLGVVKAQTIRTWRTKLLAADCPEPQAVKSYCLLRAIFNTAIKPDKLIRENPCQIDGYDKYDTPERVPATVGQVFALVDKMPERFRALVIVAAFSSIRWGELAALRRCDVDASERVVRVPRELAVLRTGMEIGPPKSAAGRRSVALPEVAIEALERHLEAFAGAGGEALIFTGAKNAYLRRSTFTRAVKWRKICNELGLPPEFTFHDLRHTGNNIAAASGASTRELMARMGHSTFRAALIYQSANSDRDKEIAKAMEVRIQKSAKAISKPKPAVNDNDKDGSADVPATLF